MSQQQLATAVNEAATKAYLDHAHLRGGWPNGLSHALVASLQQMIRHFAAEADRHRSTGSEQALEAYESVLNDLAAVVDAMAAPVEQRPGGTQ